MTLDEQIAFCEEKSKNIKLKAEPQTFVEWAERLRTTSHCLLHRKELGWDIERILTTPLRGKNNGKTKS